MSTPDGLPDGYDDIDESDRNDFRFDDPYSVDEESYRTIILKVIILFAVFIAAEIIVIGIEAIYLDQDFTLEDLTSTAFGAINSICLGILGSVIASRYLEIGSTKRANEKFAIHQYLVYRPARLSLEQFCQQFPTITYGEFCSIDLIDKRQTWFDWLNDIISLSAKGRPEDRVELRNRIAVYIRKAASNLRTELESLAKNEALIVTEHMDQDTTEYFEYIIEDLHNIEEIIDRNDDDIWELLIESCKLLQEDLDRTNLFKDISNRKIPMTF